MDAETIRIEIEPNFFRKSAIRKDVTILECKTGNGTAAIHDYDLTVECDGHRFNVKVSFFVATNSASAFGVHRMFKHFNEAQGWWTSGRRERQDSGRVIAVRKAVEMFVDRTQLCLCDSSPSCRSHPGGYYLRAPSVLDWMGRR